MADARDAPRDWPPELEAPKQRVHPSAPKELNCETCDAVVAPVVTKPRWGTSEWWDDPSPFVACPRGHFLAWMDVDDDRRYSWPKT